jgi:carbamoyl-phosphate synthase large subunit
MYWKPNPRASRTVPLVSKVCDISMAHIATEIILSEFTGKKSSISRLKHKNISHFGVKEAVFPFNMFHERRPAVGPRNAFYRRSFWVFANSFGLAFFKAQEATQTSLPTSGTVLIM